MSAKFELLHLINNNSLNIIQIISPPRTISTAFEICLTESADGQIHEPFNTHRRTTFEEGCQLILDRVHQLQDQLKKEDVRLVSKDLAKHLSSEDWIELQTLISNAVFLIREPSLQIFSLLKRRISEILLGDYNADDVDNEEFFNNLQPVLNTDWQDPSWLKIESFLKNINNSALKNNMIIMSELCLRHHPILVMQELAKIFSWQSFDATSVNHWKKAVGNNFYHSPLNGIPPAYDENGILDSPWINRAIRSTSFAPLGDESNPKTIKEYPVEIQGYFLESILPSYIRLLLNPLCIGKNSINYQELSKINGIEAYILLKEKVDKTTQENSLLRELENKLRSNYPLIFETLKKTVESCLI